jgi:hypothetical protein
MELNRWPDNYFAEVEQAAFGPSNVVPGISLFRRENSGAPSQGGLPFSLQSTIEEAASPRNCWHLPE